MQRTVLGGMLLGAVLARAPADALAAGPSPSPSSPAASARDAHPASPGPSPDPLTAQLRKASADRAHIEAVKTSLEGAVAGARQQQQTLASLVVANQRAISDTEARLAAAGQRLAEATQRQTGERAAAAAARAREVLDRRVLARAVRLRYLQQDDLIYYLLSSDTSDLLSRVGTTSALTQRSHDLLARVQDDARSAEAAEAGARRDAATAALAAGELVGQMQQLRAQTRTASELIAHLGDEERAAVAEIAQANGQDADLAQRIADLRIQQLDRTIADAQEEAWREANFYLANHLGSLPGSAHPGADGVVGNLLWAAPGASMSQPFGPTSFAFEPSYLGYPHFHTGIDMAGPSGSPVLAAADGVVVSATGSSIGYGNHVVIAHSTTMLSLYGHLRSMSVHPGDTVHRGDQIGQMGSTGNSTGPHLHFEVRLHNTPTDPVPLLAPAAASS